MEYLTISQTAKSLKVKYHVIYYMAKKAMMGLAKHGNKYYTTESNIIEYFNSNNGGINESGI